MPEYPPLFAILDTAIIQQSVDFSGIFYGTAVLFNSNLPDIDSKDAIKAIRQQE